MTGAYRGGDVEHTGEGVELVGRGGRLAGADWSSNELSHGPRTTQKRIHTVDDVRFRLAKLLSDLAVALA